MKQAEKDAVLAAARAAYESEFNALSALTVDDVVTPPPDLQIQLDQAKSQVTDLQSQLSALQSQNDTLKITNASLQNKIDMAKTALS